MADVAQLMGHDQADLVTVVTIEQGVEEDHALGRSQPGDVRVGRGRAPARVHRVHLADGDPRVAGQSQDVGAQLALGQRRKVVEDRVQHHGGQRRQPGAEHHGAGAHRRPPPPRKAPCAGDDRGAACRGERRLDNAGLGRIGGPCAPGLGVQAHRHRAAARERAQGQRRQRERQRQPGGGRGASGDRPPRPPTPTPTRPDAPERRGRPADELRQRDRVDQAARQHQSQLRPCVPPAAVDLVGREVRLHVDADGLVAPACGARAPAAQPRPSWPPEAPATAPERVNACSPARL